MKSASKQQVIWRRLATGVETAILATSVAVIVSDNTWVLVAWEALTILYLGGGLVLSWRGGGSTRPSRTDVDRSLPWAWVVPLAASATGVYSAIAALASQRDGSGQTLPVAVAASVGVFLSWALLQVGFAYIYHLLDAADAEPSIRFPGEANGTAMDYLYFAFTIGTAFATSDAQVTALRARRIVLIHSTLSFLYNALVVAVAFQVLQQTVQR